MEGRDKEGKGEGRQTQTLVVGDIKVTCKITVLPFLE